RTREKAWTQVPATRPSASPSLPSPSLVTAGSSPGGGGLGMDPGAHPRLPCRPEGLACPDVDDRPAVALQQEGGPAGLFFLLLEPLPLQPEIGVAEVADHQDRQPVLQPSARRGMQFPPGVDLGG